MTQILAIGRYHGMDARAMQAEFGAASIDAPEELETLSDAARAAVIGVAYKGHQAFGAAQMDMLPNLRMIAKYGVGYDAIDIPAARARGITVTNTPDVLNDDVADLAVGMWIAALREIETGIHCVRSGTWASGKAPPLAHKVTGRRVGILGLGRIGREIADRLAAFKCEIHYQSRSEKETPGWTRHADAASLAGAVDDLFVAVVGGRETEGLVDAPVLAALGAGGWLINIARGSVVDEEALLEALEARAIAGAALDVFRGEPKADPRLTSRPDVLPLPHIGTATVETRRDMGILLRQNLHALLNGTPPLTPVC